MAAARLLTIAALIFGVQPGIAAQSGLWPPVLLTQPSSASAPTASAALLAGKGMTVNAVALDAAENIYIAGTGSAPDVPGLDRGYDATPDGGDAFVAKLDRNGAPMWATYVGGTDQRIGTTVRQLEPDKAWGIAVDNAGQVYIVGTTSALNFPVVGGVQSSASTGTSGFIAKLSADGRRLVYSSYIGSSGDVLSPRHVAVGVASDVWIEADAAVGRFSTSNDVSSGSGNVVIIKLNSSGSPSWSTRIGLSEVGGFAVDASGRAYASGPDCTMPAGPCRGEVVLRLDSSGRQLQYSTTLPNRNADLYPSQLALLPGGAVAIAGVAYSPLQLRNAWSEHVVCGFFPDCGDAFLAIANEAGAFETVSYLGLGETAPTIAADTIGRITISVQTMRTNLPLLRPLVDHNVDGPVYVSRDRATTWHVESSATLPPMGAADLDLDPVGRNLYVAAGDILQSNADAMSWRIDSQGAFDLKWYAMAIDPRQPSVRYGISGDHVYRHDAGTDGWRLVSRSGPGTYRRSVAVSPHDSSVWIAGNAGVSMSADGGASWNDRSAGLPNLHGSSATVTDLEIDPRRAETVYAMTQVGLYVTADNGVTWQHMTSGVSPAPYTTAMAFDPIDANILHLATLTHGLLKSSDGGRTWSPRLTGSRITAVQTDPLKRHIVYAAGSDAERRNVAYRSIDHGDSWHLVTAGLDMRYEPSRLVVDTRDSLNLFLASAGLSAVPYIQRLAPAASNPRSFALEFASYLGHGEVQALAAGISGGLVGAMTHSWPAADANQRQIVTLRIAP
jgi:hypothetical protein